MGSNYGILAGLLGGFGGAAQQIGGAFTRQQEEALAREKLAIEQQRADQAAAQNQALIAESQATRAQNQSQFDATQKAASTPIASLYKALGMPVPANVDPYERVPTAMGDKLLSGMQEQQKAQREQDARIGQAGVLERLGAGSPATPAVEPPDEGAMYSAGTPATPEVAAQPRLQHLGALLRQGPLGEYLAKALEAEAPKYGHAPPGSALTKDGVVTGMVPATPREPKEQGTNTHVVQTAQGQVAVTVDAQGNEVGRVRVGDLPPHAPKDPAQPSAASLLDATMRQYQAARAQFGPDDQRTKDLAERAAALKSYVVAPGGDVVGPAGTGTRTAGPEKPNVIGDLLSGKYAQPGAPGAAPAAKPVAPAPTPPPPFPNAIRIRRQDGLGGWLRPGEPMPAGAQAVR